MAVYTDNPFKPPLVLRQPPPPVRLPKGGSPMHGIHSGTLGKRKEEDKTESCSNVAARTRPFIFRRCKSKMLKTTNTEESLPDEIIFEILVRVPAEDLYHATRLVCRKWLKIIHTHDFVGAHLQRWNCGTTLLAQTEYKGIFKQPFLASGKSSLVDMSKIIYRFMQDALSSCNGLVLELDESMRDLYITNPVTMQSFGLPRLPNTFILHPFSYSKIRFVYAMGYAATSMVYKVVRAFTQTYESPDGGVAILTVGVDKEWTRLVSIRHLSLEAKNLCLSQRTLTTQGFVHWAQNDCVLTLNLETEIITQFSAPPCSLPRNELVNKYYYLPMGSHLSLLIVRSVFSWEFWEMKPNTGEWTKQPDIDFEAQFAGQLNCIPAPGGWLKFREVLVFNMSFDKSDPRFPGASRVCFACNIRTHEFLKFELVDKLKHFLAHSKTLEWLV